MMLTVCFLLLWLYSLVSVKNRFPQMLHLQSSDILWTSFMCRLSEHGASILSQTFNNIFTLFFWAFLTGTIRFFMFPKTGTSQEGLCYTSRRSVAEVHVFIHLFRCSNKRTLDTLNRRFDVNSHKFK